MLTFLDIHWEWMFRLDMYCYVMFLDMFSQVTIEVRRSGATPLVVPGKNAVA